MKRRTFIRIATTASAALYFSNIQCHQKTKPFTKLLAHPQALQHLFDSKTIHEIGEVYQKQAKDASDETALVRLLSEDKQGKLIGETADSAFIASILSQKIQEDFEQNKIVVVNGWVLSLTEARQCALFSLTEN
jgi:hypothetical protein